MLPMPPVRSATWPPAVLAGSHLVDRLMQAGDEVIVSTTPIPAVRPMCASGGITPYEFIRHDVTELIKLEVDRIWHLACPASPIHYQTDPVKPPKPVFSVLTTCSVWPAA